MESEQHSGRITLEPGKRDGRPCIRGLRIAVYDVLSWLSQGMTTAEIIDDYPELEATDVQAALHCAAERQQPIVLA